MWLSFLFSQNYGISVSYVPNFPTMYTINFFYILLLKYSWWINYIIVILYCNIYALKIISFAIVTQFFQKTIAPWSVCIPKNVSKSCTCVLCPSLVKYHLFCFYEKHRTPLAWAPGVPHSYKYSLSVFTSKKKTLEIYTLASRARKNL